MEENVSPYDKVDLLMKALISARQADVKPSITQIEADLKEVFDSNSDMFKSTVENLTGLSSYHYSHLHGNGPVWKSHYSSSNTMPKENVELLINPPFTNALGEPENRYLKAIIMGSLRRQFIFSDNGSRGDTIEGKGCWEILLYALGRHPLVDYLSDKVEKNYDDKSPHETHGARIVESLIKSAYDADIGSENQKYYLRLIHSEPWQDFIKESPDCKKELAQLSSLFSQRTKDLSRKKEKLLVENEEVLKKISATETDQRVLKKTCGLLKEINMQPVEA